MIIVSQQAHEQEHGCEPAGPWDLSSMVCNGAEGSKEQVAV